MTEDQMSELRGVVREEVAGAVREISAVIGAITATGMLWAFIGDFSVWFVLVLAAAYAWCSRTLAK